MNKTFHYYCFLESRHEHAFFLLDWKKIAKIHSFPKKKEYTDLASKMSAEDGYNLAIDDYEKWISEAPIEDLISMPYKSHIRDTAKAIRSLLKGE